MSSAFSDQRQRLSAPDAEGLRACGVVNPDAPELPEYIRSLAATDQGAGTLELRI
jgi:hypothetical protein